MNWKKNICIIIGPLKLSFLMPFGVYAVDYKLKDWEKLRKEFTEYMAAKYPDKEVILTIETEYV